MNHKLLFLAFVALLFSGVTAPRWKTLRQRRRKIIRNVIVQRQWKTVSGQTVLPFPVKHIRLVIIIPCQASWMILPS